MLLGSTHLYLPRSFLFSDYHFLVGTVATEPEKEVCRKVQAGPSAGNMQLHDATG